MGHYLGELVDTQERLMVLRREYVHSRDERTLVEP